MNPPITRFRPHCRVEILTINRCQKEVGKSGAMRVAEKLIVPRPGEVYQIGSITSWREGTGKCADCPRPLKPRPAEGSTAYLTDRLDHGAGRRDFVGEQLVLRQGTVGIIITRAPSPKLNVS